MEIQKFSISYYNVFKKAQNFAKLIAEKLNYIGTMCVEYFLDESENLLVNEIAPKVHNSGHLTLNAFNISQFENHIRAVTGLKKKNVKKISNAEMINILGNEIQEYRKRSFAEREFLGCRFDSKMSGLWEGESPGVLRIFPGPLMLDPSSLLPSPPPFRFLLLHI